jgi:hypothetical protein
MRSIGSRIPKFRVKFASHLTGQFRIGGTFPSSLTLSHAEGEKVIRRASIRSTATDGGATFKATGMELQEKWQNEQPKDDPVRISSIGEDFAGFADSIEFTYFNMPE